MVAVASSSGSHGSGSASKREELVVGLGADHEAVLGGDAGERVVELGVDEQHRRARVLDDVADLVGVEPEVDRHEHAPPPAHAEEGREQAGRVLRDDRHPLTLRDAEPVEARGLRTRELGASACR